MPSRPCSTLPVFTICCSIALREIDRNGERHPLVAAGVGVDLRVDADHRAARIEQRTARVAGIHRRIGLDERHRTVAGKRAAGRADDARGRGLLEAERRADREHVVAHAELVGIAEPHGRQAFRIDLQHRDVAGLVRTQHLGFEFPMIDQLDRHLLRAVDDMSVGEDQSVGADDEARALARAWVELCGRGI